MNVVVEDGATHLEFQEGSKLRVTCCYVHRARFITGLRIFMYSHSSYLN